MEFCSRLGYSHVDLIKDVARSVTERGIAMKINTTLTPLNWQEDMHPLIQDLNPYRWKVFQVHHLHGINDAFFAEFGSLDDVKFADFMARHADLHPIGEVINNLILVAAITTRLFGD